VSATQDQYAVSGSIGCQVSRRWRAGHANRTSAIQRIVRKITHLRLRRRRFHACQLTKSSIRILTPSATSIFPRDSFFWDKRLRSQLRQDLNLQQIYGGGGLDGVRRKAGRIEARRSTRSRISSPGLVGESNLIGHILRQLSAEAEAVTLTQELQFVPATTLSGVSHREDDTFAFRRTRLQLSRWDAGHYLNDPPAPSRRPKRNSFQFTRG